MPKIKTDPNYKPQGEKRKMILFYNDMRNAIDNLDNNQLGELMRDIFTLEMDDSDAKDFSDVAVKILYTSMRFSVLEHKQNYKHSCAVNHEIAKIRTKRHDKDKDKDKDKDTDTDKGNESDTDIVHTPSLSERPPSYEEVAQYIYENDIEDVDPELFVDKMEECGWLNSRGQPLKSWKAAVRVWEKRAQDYY